MNIISSSVEINEYKLLNIKSLYFAYTLAKLKILDYLGFHKYLEEAGCDFIDLEFIGVYNELEVYITIKNYKNNVKPLKELKELEFLRDQEINEIKRTTKIKLNLLNCHLNDILMYLEYELKYVSLRNIFFNRLNTYEAEIKLRLATKEKINEIERLKGEVRNNEVELLTVESKISKLLTDLKYEKEDILHGIMVSKLKLRRLGVSSMQINRIKNSILSS